MTTHDDLLKRFARQLAELRDLIDEFDLERGDIVQAAGNKIVAAHATLKLIYEDQGDG